MADLAKKLLGDALKAIAGAITSILSDISSTVEQIVDIIVKDAPGITKMLDNLLYDYFTNQTPIFELQDPFPVSAMNPIGPAKTSQNRLASGKFHGIP